MHEFMDASDIIVGKSGGLTTSEMLTKNKPLVIIDPIPGQEQINCEYLLESGVAARLFDIEDASDKINSIINDPSKIKKMSDSAKKIMKPFAANTIVHDVLSRISKTNNFLTRV
jgi:processive 1,2-diacylglycerol beta-glucosyltransferase